MGGYHGHIVRLLIAALTSVNMLYMAFQDGFCKDQAKVFSPLRTNLCHEMLATRADAFFVGQGMVNHFHWDIFGEAIFHAGFLFSFMGLHKDFVDGRFRVVESKEYFGLVKDIRNT